MKHDYDLYGPEIFADPYPLYRRLRSDHPVHLDSHLGCWIVTCYTDVLASLANRSLSSQRSMRAGAFQSQAWKDLSPLFEHISNLMFFADPPRHTRIRSLINKAFSARMIERWAGHIQRIVDECLDRVQQTGRMDVIRDLALPLPQQVIADMLGIPRVDHDRFKRWSDDLVDFLGNPPTLELCTRLQHSLQEFMDYFREVVAQHTARPGEENLVSALLQAREQGDALSEDELLVNCVGLFAGGHETTTHLIGNGLLALLRNPGELQLLRAHPELITSAVEELLRYDSPVQFTARIAREPLEIRGRKIYRGQGVLLMLGSANRDPEQFPDPDRLDIRRQNNHHLAFGHNVHYCVGAALGRLEAQIALRTMLQRLPGLQLDNRPLIWQENLSFHGVNALHVTF